MSFNPNPRFVPTPGTPTAAPRPDFYAWYPRYPCWKGHRTMAQVIADEGGGRTDFEAALDRVCPKCGAEPGLICRNPRGGIYGIHTVRRAA